MSDKGEKMKTRLGISVALLGAFTYFAGLISGYVVQIIVAGYILIYEKDTLLKRTAVKSVVICVSFSLLSAFIEFIPNMFDMVSSLAGLFDQALEMTKVTMAISFITKALEIFRNLLLISFGIFALKNQSVSIGFFDKIIDRHFEETANPQ